MYRLFFEIQKKHWWFVTKKNIVLDFISKFLPPKSEMKILDIGCGSGLMLNSLEKYGQTFGMDMSDEAIAFSKEVFSGNIRQGSLPDRVPFENNYFDLVTALDVIEHIDNDADALKSLKSIISNQGKAIITVPAFMFLWSHFDVINEHKRRYTLKELNTKLLEAGFKVEKISYYNTLLFPIVAVIRIINNLLNRHGSSDLDMPSLIVNTILKKIFGLEKYMLRYINLPFGVSIIAVVSK